MKTPSALDMARQAIKDNPKLFKPGLSTELIIIDLMGKYHEKCKAYVNQHQQEVNEILQSLNNLQK